MTAVIYYVSPIKQRFYYVILFIAIKNVIIIM